MKELNDVSQQFLYIQSLASLSSTLKSISMLVTIQLSLTASLSKPKRKLNRQRAMLPEGRKLKRRNKRLGIIHYCEYSKDVSIETATVQ